MSGGGLAQALEVTAARFPAAIAVAEADGAALTYAELARLSDRARDHLAALGVGPGDRVGLCLSKSIDALAALLGVLKTGAAYVPVDVGAPAARSALI
ncbi:MAG: AMP-binding protein, partial [Thermoanaerobaculia bacterium]